MKKECPQPFSDHCESVVYQNSEISLPIQLFPEVNVGKIKLKLEQEPHIAVSQNKSGKCRCELSVTQILTYQIPIEYHMQSHVGETSVVCECMKDDDQD